MAPHIGLVQQRQTQAGLTLVELLVVVALLGIVAAAAIPSFVPLQEETVDLAAAEVADALRFARSEALRTGAVHGIRVNRTTAQVTVYRPTLFPATDPPTIAAVLYHPVDKRSYDFNLTRGDMTAGVTVTNPTAPFNFTGLGVRGDLLFDATGTPFYLTGAAVYRLAGGEILLAKGAASRTVSLQPLTGRVTVQ